MEIIMSEQGTRVDYSNEDLSQRPLTAENLGDLLDKGRLSFKVGHSHIVGAIASAYVIYRLRNQVDDKGWLDGQIKLYNSEIKKHNKAIADSEGLSDEEKKDRKRLEAKAMDGASKFTVLVKFMFRFDKPHHSSMVSRYTTALEWIDRHYAKAPANFAMPDEITVRINKDEGGLNTIIEDQRRHQTGGDSGKPSAEDIQKTQNEIVRLTRQSVKIRAAKASIPKIEAKDSDGLVLLVARQTDINTEILGPAEVDPDVFNQVLRLAFRPSPMDGDHGLELLGRVAALGRLADGDKGMSGIPVVPGRPESRAMKSMTRIMTMRPLESGKPEIIVSTNRSDASIVVQAIPKNGALAAPKCAVYMLPNNRQTFESNLTDPTARPLFRMAFNDQPTQADGSPASSAYEMVVSNTVLQDDDGNAKFMKFYWNDLDNLGSKPPIRSSSFKPQFTTTISKADIHGALSDFLGKWADAKDRAKAKAEVIEIELSDGELTLSADEADDYTVLLTTPVTGSHSLRFRSKDIVNTFQQLALQEPNTFTLAGDDDGVLQITWDDDLANYDLSIPTTMDKGVLNPKMFDKLRTA
jgi:hypothetical protein